MALDVEGFEECPGSKEGESNTTSCFSTNTRRLMGTDGLVRFSAPEPHWPSFDRYSTIASAVGRREGSFVQQQVARSHT